jgi:hypothetical protein
MDNFQNHGKRKTENAGETSALHKTAAKMNAARTLRIKREDGTRKVQDKTVCATASADGCHAGSTLQSKGKSRSLVVAMRFAARSG